ncbi:vacuolar protein sorting-associated protein 26C-like [Macrosteles quadrilineatus]|uniref:vacuolar protein sorting-associated protein 26C-like n=1 Tax=Macrosteles quadrilineatus TaxID=74068 RepID=UPI0023E1E470|nr:vacuolar protein sorting-associated protein 26C-like [Macrosteles quadrilineatus]XP_054275426.1 vacuolar protein sorting-associated protein 26C-like [Macrosteles quadrilineatus]
MSVTLDIRVKKANKVYHEGETISGVVIFNSPSDLKHDGITLNLEGTVNLQLSPKNVGVFEAFYNSVKPIQLVQCSIEVAAPGKMPSGKTEVPFEAPLYPRPNKTLFETYHGVFINIQYLLRCTLKRSFLAKDLTKVAEFIVEYKASQCEKAVPSPVKFSIAPESLQNVRDRGRIPRFAVSGMLDSTVCCITKPFTGHLVVESCEIGIKSIELQLVRVETCGCAEGYARDATEIQNIQIGEGNVARGIHIPIYMIFPRLFTCPTLSTSNFKVEFEVNIVIIFENDHLVTENFPITLKRS